MRHVFASRGIGPFGGAGNSRICRLCGGRLCPGQPFGPSPPGLGHRHLCPEEVLARFPHAIPTGIAHGTVTVVWEGEPFEVTTFRAESAYTDHRHPDQVRFVPDLEADLARRDFTVNAMACRRDGQVIDRFGGGKI